MSDLFETLRPGDLEYLVSDTLSIDQYTSKADEDNITVGIFVDDKNAGRDLYSLLSRIFIDEIRDIDLSNNITKQNAYPLFVEFSRNKYFYNILEDLIDTLSRLTGIKKWYFKSEDNEKREINEENIISFIRLSKMSFTDVENPSKPNEDKQKEEKEIKEFLQTGTYRKSDNVIIVEDAYDRYDWEIEGFITEEQMDEELSNAEETGTPTYLTLIEAFPYHQFIETEDKLFLQRDNKILMLKYLG